MNIKEIKKIALKVRKEFEEKEINIKTLTDLYNNYNKIENINDFIMQAQIMFPKGNCGIASLYLKYVLKEGTIQNLEYKNNKHTVLVIDKNIIDITSDQYNGPKIYIGPINKPYRL
ncbi:MAG: hypothetical protein UR98_C0040G0026 [Parcubacteria group bacterium GW2011_GWA1_36_12]|nr:MAG: hypothetical protein UR98_C0040G0026 [Parcubacteria group bacterium GW2011_GWA1_36_12]